jgi:hypothetical protein
MMSTSALLIISAENADGIVRAEPGATAIVRGLALNLVRNPLVIALALGVLWHVTGAPLAGLPRVMVDRIADVASTLALFAMGMSLRNYGIRGNIRAGFVSALKLLLMPALVLLTTRYLIPLPPVWALSRSSPRRARRASTPTSSPAASAPARRSPRTPSPSRPPSRSCR